jgi:hypothetical protein
MHHAMMQMMQRTTGNGQTLTPEFSLDTVGGELVNPNMDLDRSLLLFLEDDESSYRVDNSLSPEAH